MNAAFKEQAEVMQSHLKMVLDTATELHKDDTVQREDAYDAPINNSKIMEVKRKLA